jgi:hypothetical protein
MTRALRCPDCTHATRFDDGDDGDPDAAFGDLLAHIHTRHPDVDQTPANLWPRIKETR